MSLFSEVERILASIVQELPKESSVLVQFASGDWEALKQAFLSELALQNSGIALKGTIVEAPVPVVETLPIIDVSLVETPIVEAPTPIVDTLVVDTTTSDVSVEAAASLANTGE